MSISEVIQCTCITIYNLRGHENLACRTIAPQVVFLAKCHSSQLKTACIYYNAPLYLRIALNLNYFLLQFLYCAVVMTIYTHPNHLYWHCVAFFLNLYALVVIVTAVKTEVSPSFSCVFKIILFCRMRICFVFLYS